MGHLNSGQFTGGESFNRLRPFRLRPRLKLFFVPEYWIQSDFPLVPSSCPHIHTPSLKPSFPPEIYYLLQFHLM